VVSHLASQSASSKAAAGAGEGKGAESKSGDLLSAQRLRLHLVGAAEYECDNALAFEELLHLLPNLTTLSLCLIGPSLPAARLQAERAPWVDAVTAQYAPRAGDDRPLVVRDGVGARSDGSPLLAATYEGLPWRCARPLRRCVLRAPCSVRVCGVLVVDRVVTFVRQLCLLPLLQCRLDSAPSAASTRSGCCCTCAGARGTSRPRRRLCCQPTPTRTVSANSCDSDRS
jgi:hypothetical protein